MPDLRRLTGSATALARRLWGQVKRQRGKPRHQRERPPADRRAIQTSEPSPGQSGPQATVEVDPRDLAAVRISYTPKDDGKPDPGEVVWTWVPYQENDGRGKDRPVVLVAAEPGGTFLAIQLTSKKHNDDDFVAVGTGGWDSDHRPSWANLARIIRVHPDGLRREGTKLSTEVFARVADALQSRFGWEAAADDDSR